jgi:hypothetical protein
VIIHSIHGNVCRIRYGHRQAEYETERGQIFVLDGNLEKQ